MNAERQFTHKRVIIDYTKRESLPRIVYCLASGPDKFNAIIRAVGPSQWAKHAGPDVTSDSEKANIACVAFAAVRKATPFGRLIEATNGVDRSDPVAMLAALGLGYHGR